MIKTIFVPLMAKSAMGYNLQDVSRRLSDSMNAALVELDTALDDGWRILDKQYIEAAQDSGVVFFLRDDGESLLLEQPDDLPIGVSDDLPF